MTLADGALARGAAGVAVGLLAALPARWLGERLVGRPMPRRLLVSVLAAAGALAAMLAGRGGASMHASLLAVTLALVLGLLAVVDAASFRLPDALTLPLAAAGLVLAGAGDVEVADRLAGAVLGFASLAAAALAFHRMTGRAGLGMGDAKLFGAAGAWVGWALLPQVLLVACGVGLAWAAVRVLRHGLTALRRPIPFGPGLCAGLLLIWLLALPGGG